MASTPEKEELHVFTGGGLKTEIVNTNGKTEVGWWETCVVTPPTKIDTNLSGDDFSPKERLSTVGPSLPAAASGETCLRGSSGRFSLRRAMKRPTFLLTTPATLPKPVSNYSRNPFVPFIPSRLDGSQNANVSSKQFIRPTAIRKEYNKLQPSKNSNASDELVYLGGSSVYDEKNTPGLLNSQPGTYLSFGGPGSTDVLGLKLATAASEVTISSQPSAAQHKAETNVKEPLPEAMAKFSSVATGVRNDNNLGEKWNDSDYVAAPPSEMRYLSGNDLFMLSKASQTSADLMQQFASFAMSFLPSFAPELIRSSSRRGRISSTNSLSDAKDGDHPFISLQDVDVLAEALLEENGTAAAAARLCISKDGLEDIPSGRAFDVAKMLFASETSQPSDAFMNLASPTGQVPPCHRSAGAPDTVQDDHSQNNDRPQLSRDSAKSIREDFLRTYGAYFRQSGLQMCKSGQCRPGTKSKHQDQLPVELGDDVPDTPPTNEMHPSHLHMSSEKQSHRPRDRAFCEKSASTVDFSGGTRESPDAHSSLPAAKNETMKQQSESRRCKPVSACSTEIDASATQSGGKQAAKDAYHHHLRLLPAHFRQTQEMPPALALGRTLVSRLIGKREGTNTPNDMGLARDETIPRNGKLSEGFSLKGSESALDLLTLRNQGCAPPATDNCGSEQGSSRTEVSAPRSRTARRTHPPSPRATSSSACPSRNDSTAGSESFRFSKAWFSENGAKMVDGCLNADEDTDFCNRLRVHIASSNQTNSEGKMCASETSPSERPERGRCAIATQACSNATLKTSDNSLSTVPEENDISARRCGLTNTVVFNRSKRGRETECNTSNSLGANSAINVIYSKAAATTKSVWNAFPSDDLASDHCRTASPQQTQKLTHKSTLPISMVRPQLGHVCFSNVHTTLNAKRYTNAAQHGDVLSEDCQVCLESKKSGVPGAAFQIKRSNVDVQVKSALISEPAPRKNCYCCCKCENTGTCGFAAFLKAKMAVTDNLVSAQQHYCSESTYASS